MVILITPVGEVIVGGERCAVRVHLDLDDAHPSNACQSAPKVPHHQRRLDAAFIVKEDKYPDGGVVNNVCAVVMVRGGDRPPS